MNFIILILYSFSLLINLSNLNYLIIFFFILILYIIFYFFINDFFIIKKLQWLKYNNIVLLFFIYIILLYNELNILWIIIILESISFFILGSYFFYRKIWTLKYMESSLNYIFPAFISFFLLLSSILNVFWPSNLFVINEVVVNLFLVFSIFIKLGSFPFFFWIPKVFKKASFFSILIIGIISKIFLIIIMLSYIKIMYKLLVILAFSSIIISLFFMINSTKTKDFLAYSSIANIGWIFLILAIDRSFSIWSFYYVEVLILFFFIYSFNFVMLCYYLNDNGSLFILFICSDIYPQKLIWIYFTIIFISLANMSGIPPFAGFFAKYFILNYLLMYNKILTFFIIIFSILFVFIYIRPIISINYSNSPNSISLKDYKNSYLIKYPKQNVYTFCLYLNLLFTFILF